MFGLLVGSGVGAAIAPFLGEMRQGSNLDSAGAGADPAHLGTISVKSSRVELLGDRVVGGGVVLDRTSFVLTERPGQEPVKSITHSRSADFVNIEPFVPATSIVNTDAWDDLFSFVAAVGNERPTSTEVKRVGDRYVGRTTYDRSSYIDHKNLVRFADGAAERVIKDRIEVEFSIAVDPDS